MDKILKKTKIVKNFNVLSIDIDSFDLQIWRSLKKYRPKIVVIEINSGIPLGVKQTHNPPKIGNSFTSTVEYATKNNYQLVCHTGNCIFIDKKYVKKLKINKKFLKNKNANLLFDTTWFSKKEFFLKRLARLLLHKTIIDFLRQIKIKINL